MSARISKSFLLAALLGAPLAFAGGVALSAEELPAGTVRALQAQLGAARINAPGPYDAVRELVQSANALDAKKRGPLAPMGRAFKQVGPGALFPMLEVLALDQGAVQLKPLAAKAVTIGILEALGDLRSPEAEPVLLAVLSSARQHPDVLRTAADAYGMRQTDAVAAELVRRSQAGGEAAKAIRAGMGSCRRSVVASELAAHALEPGEVRERIAVLRALGEVGNAWAWKTPGVTARTEEAEVRATAARALVRAFTTESGEVRQAASDALMVVDAPQTPALLAEARSAASGEQLAALDGLARRFEKNPTR